MNIINMLRGPPAKIKIDRLSLVLLLRNDFYPEE